MYIDLAFSFVFMPLVFLLIPTERWLQHNTGFFVVQVLYFVCIYFLNRRFNIPALLLNKKYQKAACVFATMLLATYLLSLVPFADDNDTIQPFTHQIRQRFRLQMIWFMFLLVSGFCFSTGLLIELFRQKMSRQEVEAEKNKAELALYKAQINPHFMFNTLNTLYGLLLTQSDKVESVFIKFTDILKYMYANTHRDMISIQEEIAYIEQYIDLQMLRLNEYTTVKFSNEVDDHQVDIPPMILITFVENAFKYGTSSSESSTISITIRLDRGRLEFRTNNPVLNHRRPNGDGIGIDNCRHRLDLIYPGRYVLQVLPNEHTFDVLLEIQLIDKQ